jgi:uncharacterized integral membrane protein (TIGR00698 family)
MSRPRAARVLRFGPGIALCAGIAALARLAQEAEEVLLGQPYVEALVLAILLGAAIRSGWEPEEIWRPGVRLAAGPMLEVAVALLGASLDLRAVAAFGPWLPLGIAGVVASALLLGYGLGRVLRLGHRMATLVACGSAICGNSAIAAVAPVLGATPREVASAIAFTAVLGVALVLALPALVPAFGLSPAQYGAVAGLTVYAVPQVLAATAPFGTSSMQAGILFKLVRVLMLGPLVLALSIWEGRRRRDDTAGASGGWRPARYVPLFVVAFAALALARSLELLPEGMVGPLRFVAGLLTAAAMAALGLGVDVRGLVRTGRAVVMTASGSLAVLGVLSLGLVTLLGIG